MLFKNRKENTFKILYVFTEKLVKFDVGMVGKLKLEPTKQ